MPSAGGRAIRRPRPKKKIQGVEFSPPAGIPSKETEPPQSQSDSSHSGNSVMRKRGGKKNGRMEWKSGASLPNRLALFISPVPGPFLTLAAVHVCKPSDPFDSSENSCLIILSPPPSFLFPSLPLSPAATPRQEKCHGPTTSKLDCKIRANPNPK